MKNKIKVLGAVFLISAQLNAGQFFIKARKLVQSENFAIGVVFSYPILCNFAFLKYAKELDKKKAQETNKKEENKKHTPIGK